jgi:hypothetical protein
MFITVLKNSNHTKHPKQSNLNLGYSTAFKKEDLPKLGCCGDCCCACCCFSNMAMSVADEFAEDGFIGKAEKLKYYKIDCFV